MPTERSDIGAWGEEIATRHYRQRGFVVLDRNWRCSLGELDLVVQKKYTVYVVEVKTRTTTLFGYPEEAITRAKRQRLRKCAAVYLQEHRALGRVRICLQICSILQDRHKIYLRIYTLSGD